MAIVSGTIAALTVASKVLAGTMTKKAVIDGAKKFVKGKAKNAVKNRVTGKGRKKKGRGGEGGTEEPGAITRAGSSDITPTSPMFGGMILPIQRERFNNQTTNMWYQREIKSVQRKLISTKK